MNRDNYVELSPWIYPSPIGKLAACGSTPSEKEQKNCTEADRGRPMARAGFSGVWDESGSRVRDVVDVEVALASIDGDVHGIVG